MNSSLKFLGLFIFAFIFFGCSNDDKEEVIQDELLGKWEVVSALGDDEYWEKPCIFNFRENDRLTIIFAQGKNNEESVPCKYSTTGSLLYIDFAYGDDVFEGTYKINKNTMTFDFIIYDPDYPEDIYEDFLTLKRVK